MSEAYERVLRWREANRDRYLEYSRRHREATREQRRESERQRYAAKKDQLLAHKDVWRRSHPDEFRLMARAHIAVQRAVRKGVLTRPASCSACGVVAYIEAAHVDYEPPYLNVRWLCRPCHRTWDKNSPKLRESN